MNHLKDLPNTEGYEFIGVMKNSGALVKCVVAKDTSGSHYISGLRSPVSYEDLQGWIVNSIEDDFESLSGKKFKDLRDTEKKKLYAYELLKDGAGEDTARDTSEGCTPGFIDQQLRNTFDYTDERIL